MDNPISKTPQNPNAMEDLVLSFGSLEFRKEGSCWQQNNASSSSGSNSYNTFEQEEDEVNDTTNVKIIKNQSYVSEKTSDDKTQWFLQNHVFDPCCRFFANEGEGLGSKVHNYGEQSLWGSCDDLGKPENYFNGASSSSRQPRIEYSLCNSPSKYSFVSQYFKESPLCDEDLKNDTRNNSDLSYAEREPQFKLDFLLEILGRRDYEQIDMLVSEFQGSYLRLMIDKHMSVFFQNLVDACRVEQLNSIVAEVLCCSRWFIEAAFYGQGSRSIVRLIKKLKRSNHAFSVTEALSTRFFDIMTHDIARVVIQKCFIYFGDQPNTILYQKAILHFQELATHKVGCRSLNFIIDTIVGDERSMLLNNIADDSAYLSNDPYGNYVVQHVLALKSRDVTSRIVLSLKGQIAQLARKPGGSRIVQKCMESFEFGIVFVVQEILEENPKAPFWLANDHFGNYVIQTALKKTKEHGFSNLYDSLVKSLRPYWKQLNHTAGGKNVLNFLMTFEAQSIDIEHCGVGGATTSMV